MKNSHDNNAFVKCRDTDQIIFKFKYLACYAFNNTKTKYCKNNTTLKCTWSWCDVYVGAARIQWYTCILSYSAHRSRRRPRYTLCDPRAPPPPPGLSITRGGGGGNQRPARCVTNERRPQLPRLAGVVVRGADLTASPRPGHGPRYPGPAAPRI